jgi:hypothetical protein
MVNRMTLKMLVAATAAVLGWAMPARAENGAVVVYGDAKPHDREVVASELVQQLRASSWAVASSPLPQREGDAIVAACIPLDRPWPCVAAKIGNASYDRVVVVKVENDKTAKDLVLTGQIVLAGDFVPSADRGWCQQCTDATLVTTTGDLTRLMLQHATERNPGATLAIHTVPAGAVITLDGQMIGSTDKTVTTTAGSHTILLQRSGYRNEDRTVVTENGKTATIEATLTPVDGGAVVTPQPHPPPEHHWVVPALVTGVGAIALVGGAIVSFDQDPPKTFTQPQYLYSGPAIAVSVVGGLAVATGLYLWLFRHPHASATASVPAVAPAPGGAVLGWFRTF